MLRFYWIILLVLLFNINAFSQNKDSLLHFPVLIHFNSICCGVPSSTPLIKQIRSFKKKYKLPTITAYRISPMGREGEYTLAFDLKEMNPLQQKSFIKKIKIISATLKDRGNAWVEEEGLIDKSSLPRNITIEKIKF